MDGGQLERCYSRVYVCFHKRARNSTFLPFTLLFLRPVISIERDPYFPACARSPGARTSACTTWVCVTRARTHAHPHFESPLTHRGDISWNYGDSSRRSICHGFNVGLILLRLLDVTISFVQPRRARYPATGIGLQAKIHRYGILTIAKFGSSLSIYARIATWYRMRYIDECNIKYAMLLI